MGTATKHREAPQTARAIAPTASQRPTAITFLTVPCPPSTNKLFRNVPGRGRVRTGGYKAWADEAGWKLLAQKPAPVPGRVIIVLGIDRSNAQSDIDNRVKAIFDLLTDHKIIQDDKYVTAFAISWNAKASDLARVAIMPASDLMLSFQIAADGQSGGWFIAAPDQEGPADDGH